MSFRLSADSSEDISDANLRKLIIVTPTASNKRQFDRTGDYISRAKMNQSLSEEMEIGLRRYEDELWNNESSRRVRIFNDNEWAKNFLNGNTL